MLSGGSWNPPRAQPFYSVLRVSGLFLTIREDHKYPQCRDRFKFRWCDLWGVQILMGRSSLSACFFVVRLFLGHGGRRQAPEPAPFVIGVALWIIVSCCRHVLSTTANGPVNLVRGARGVRSQLSPPREHLGCASRLLRAWRSPWIRCIECPDAVWHDWLNFLASHGDKKEITGHLVEQPARRRYFQVGNVRPDLLTFMIVQDDVKESVGHPVRITPSPQVFSTGQCLMWLCSLR